MAKTKTACKKTVIDIEFDTRKAVRDMNFIESQFVTVYTEDEVKKLIEAYRKKYKDYCSLPPYKMKGSKVFKGLV